MTDADRQLLTEVRDLLRQALGDKLTFGPDQEEVERQAAQIPRSFRERANEAKARAQANRERRDKRISQ